MGSECGLKYHHDQCRKHCSISTENGSLCHLSVNGIVVLSIKMNENCLKYIKFH